MYVFFIQWSPEIYAEDTGESLREPGFIVVKKKEEPETSEESSTEDAAKEWEVGKNSIKDFFFINTFIRIYSSTVKYFPRGKTKHLIILITMIMAVQFMPS